MDGDSIIPFIIGVLILLYRLFGFRKQQQNQPPPPPTHNPYPEQPQPHRGQKSLLETIMEEVEKQKKLSEAKPPVVARQKTEIKQKSYKPEKKKQRRVEEFDNMDRVEREEGVSAVAERLRRTTVLEEEPQERTFEFDPREAFMMKTLLERPYS